VRKKERPAAMATEKRSWPFRRKKKKEGSSKKKAPFRPRRGSRCALERKERKGGRTKREGLSIGKIAGGTSKKKKKTNELLRNPRADEEKKKRKRGKEKK